MTDSVVAETLEKVVGAILHPSKVGRPREGDAWYSSGGPEVLVASYQRDFERLWAIDKEGSSGLQLAAAALARRSEPLTLLVVWDGSPPPPLGPVNLAGSLTPFDWSVALSLSVVETGGDQEVGGEGALPPLRILILDLLSSGGGSAPRIQFLRHLTAREEPWLPWIRTVVPCDADGGWDLESLIRELCVSDRRPFSTLPSLANVAGGSRQERNGFRERLEMTQRLWAGEVSRRPGLDRHFVSNLLGPLLLLRELGHPEPFDLGRRALLSLVRCLEGRGSAAAREQEADGTQGTLLDQAPLDVDIDVWLVDDQQGAGWGEVVCAALGVNFTPSGVGDGVVYLGSQRRDQRTLRVFGAQDPSFLLEVLRSAFQRETGDARFELQLPGFRAGGSTDDCRKARAEPIVLLDLRLFSSGSPLAEAVHFKELIRIARGVAKARGARAWMAIPSREIDAIEEWCNEVRVMDPRTWRGKNPYLNALTLLPRLLAQADLSLPIVLFSSTGQRRVVERLERYGNVITGFEKPRFFGYADSDAGRESLHRLRRAFRDAQRLIAARVRCRELMRTPDPYLNSDQPQIQDGKKYHLELYVDESDPGSWRQKKEGRSDHYVPTWRVGGCYALFEGDDHPQARAKADAFEDLLVRKGVRYFQWTGNGPQPEANGVLSKGTPCSDQMRRAKEVALEESCSPIALGVAALECRLRSHAGKSVASHPLDPRNDDQLFLQTMRDFLELFLYESIPAIVPAYRRNRGLLELSILAGTRIRKVEDGNDAHEVVREDNYRAGIEWYGDNVPRQRSFSDDDCAPLVRGLLWRRGTMRCKRLVATGLPYQDNEGYRKPRDFVCRSCSQRFPFRDRTLVHMVVEQQLRAGDVVCGTVERVKDRWLTFTIDGPFPIKASGEAGNFAVPPREDAVYRGRVVRVYPPRNAGERGFSLVDFGAPKLGKLSGDTLRERQRVNVQVIAPTEQGYLIRLARRDQEVENLLPQVGEQYTLKIEDLRLGDPNGPLVSHGTEAQAPMKYPSDPTVFCPSCGSAAAVRPDSRALHYVADQVLTDLFGNKTSPRFSGVLPHTVGEFNEIVDRDFESVLEASRALDQGKQGLAKAAVRIPPPAIDRRSANRTESWRRPTMRDYIRWRVGRALQEQADGDVFLEIAERLRRQRRRATRSRRKARLP